MRFLTVFLSMSILTACAQQREKPIAQPTLEAGSPFAASTAPEMNKVAPLPQSVFVQNYLGPLLKSEEYVRAVISIHSVDDKNKRVSFSTLFMGKRIQHNLPFLISNEKTPAQLEVNTKTFNFSTDGTLLLIDLFEGVSQRQLAEMHRMKTFTYKRTRTPQLITAVRNETNFEVPSSHIANASSQLLTSKDVQNLDAIDLEIMKNAIYARHGAAFEEPRMIDFFSENDWYSPLFTKAEMSKTLTDIEVKNIDLIGRFEKHAKRYYEEFGR